jgi:hypothetical protein
MSLLLNWLLVKCSILQCLRRVTFLCAKKSNQKTRQRGDFDFPPLESSLKRHRKGGCGPPCRVNPQDEGRRTGVGGTKIGSALVQPARPTLIQPTRTTRPPLVQPPHPNSRPMGIQWGPEPPWSFEGRGSKGEGNRNPSPLARLLVTFLRAKKSGPPEA